MICEGEYGVEHTPHELGTRSGICNMCEGYRRGLAERDAEIARLREALTRFDQLVEAAQTSHADDGYTDADVLVGKFQDELPALLALAALSQSPTPTEKKT